MKHALGSFGLFTGLLCAQDLLDPVAVECGGKAIDVDVGHAAPFVADVDGDGLHDLLVGQYGQGRARIYRNVGTRNVPRFDRFEWFMAGGEVAQVWTN
jgi:hypothetical protein